MESSAQKTRRILHADDPLTELFAEIWHEEEVKAANGSSPRNPWYAANDGEKKRAYDRAAQVIAGEVKWSECGAGDRAIWNGRQHALSAWIRARGPLQKYRHDQHERRRLSLQPGMVEARDYTEIMPWMFYDTLEVSSKSGTSGHRLFGNANIGNTRLTNLWIAGQTGSEQVLYIADLFVTVRGVYSADVRAEAMRYLENATCYLIIGEKRCSPEIVLSDLLAARRPIDMIIPERQCFSVRLQPHRTIEMSETAFDVIVHLDGGMIRPYC